MGILYSETESPNADYIMTESPNADLDKKVHYSILCLRTNKILIKITHL